MYDTEQLCNKFYIYFTQTQNELFSLISAIKPCKMMISMVNTHAFTTCCCSCEFVRVVLSDTLSKISTKSVMIIKPRGILSKVDRKSKARWDLETWRIACNCGKRDRKGNATSWLKGRWKDNSELFIVETFLASIATRFLTQLY